MATLEEKPEAASAKESSEVSEAIDFCRHYAETSLRLHDPAHRAGARFVPVDLTVVASPWNFPLAIPTGGVAAALAAGSAVVLKPAPPAKRCAAELVRAFHDAGIPEDLVVLAPLEDGDVSRHLVTHKDVDRVVLTGSYDTARLFRSWKPDMHLLGETSGKNAIIVTPSADPDIAVRDAVYSAMTWFPEPAGLEQWRSVYMATARANGGEPDAGSHLLYWLRAAGLGDAEASASTGCYATPELRSWWGGTWAERCLSSFGPRAVELGLASPTELEEMTMAWRTWAAADDGWYVVVHGEVIARR